MTKILKLKLKILDHITGHWNLGNEIDYKLIVSYYKLKTKLEGLT